jgi:hypothetical protein
MTKEGDVIKRGNDAFDAVLKEIESGELGLGLQPNIWELSGTDTKASNPFYKLEETTDLDSFLRGFRRWKKRHEK